MWRPSGIRASRARVRDVWRGVVFGEKSAEFSRRRIVVAGIPGLAIRREYGGGQRNTGQPAEPGNTASIFVFSVAALNGLTM